MLVSSSFGEIFKVTSFGESHGPAVGVVIDGCPAGLHLDLGLIDTELKRRRTGQSKLVSQRKEPDVLEALSGLFEGRTTGTPLAFLVKNADHRPEAYSHLKDLYRPSHADFTYQEKYGLRDYRGGGRSSARETTARVIAGSVAKQVLSEMTSITSLAWVSSIGAISTDIAPASVTLEMVESNDVRCPDFSVATDMIQLVDQARKDGDSVGGVITGFATGMPSGLGAPVFDRLEADLGKAMLSLPATKGFEIGSGFAGTLQRGSQHNDAFTSKDGAIRTATNNSGGVQGGISNGEDLVFRVAFKPTATISQAQQTVTTDGEQVELEAKGRHDPCVLPRAVPIVEAMCALVLVDHVLRQRTTQL